MYYESHVLRATAPIYFSNMKMKSQVRSRGEIVAVSTITSILHCRECVLIAKIIFKKTNRNLRSY